MILKPTIHDIKIVGYYLGKIILGLACTMIIPILIGLGAGEINPALDFLIGLEIGLIFGLILTKICYTERDLNWMQGMIVVSLSWLAAMLLGAIPMYLSGHWGSYLDTCFDSMSGFATTGLTLVQNLDHISLAHNLWRHLIMFIGGQGIVIIALSFFVKGASGAFKMYVGEARDEKIMPNVMHTSRFIWLVSIVYLILGTLILGIVGALGGMKPSNAFFHGACVFMAAFDTGGFAPQSQNILYYHSFVFEIVTIAIMILGALNFKLHYHIWMGNRKEIFKNIETITLFITVIITFSITATGLTQAGIYPKAVMLFRKGFYQLISGHTGTGFQTIYARQFVNEWSHLALVGVILAMGLGGAVCSTTGAIKMLRIGIIFKALVEDIKRIILPERAIVVQKFHHIKEIFLEDKQVRGALLITLAYLVLYGLGSCVGMFYGYPFLESLFESTSAAANVGLSCGITAPSMPAVLKMTYIFQMWAGRLEFMSVFTLIGFFVAAIKGK
ncbi:MAG: cation transporter [Candidatus Omnitrophica bacterium CG08_land_8_20_14_0_20_41_16]|uniref:Cation transporter n=1 Tax=Candidatus Sherwoodlollariibacterium unditelluris TaxID=1974757 RepID=A0A2G9YKG1_9BACT|nr:MAG: cation transporter [Candidatus Omnitrophica bacterium CG23_combo_of_CG06-09_8_20_14_all_41_10]PIS33425.1 MAG: cation transporter [Candidatus Omnitrophica bacterium CG08_land_8_20_14_0_20_41_16]